MTKDSVSSLRSEEDELLFLQERFSPPVTHFPAFSLNTIDWCNKTIPAKMVRLFLSLIAKHSSPLEDSVLPFFDEIVPPPAPSSRTLIDLGEQQAKSSPRNELDDLFGPASSSQTDDCQPIFPLSSTNNRVSQLPAAAATASDADAQRKKGGLFDDLQDLLVDHSTGQKIPPTKRSVLSFFRGKIENEKWFSSFQSTSSTTGKTPLSELFKSTEVEYSFPSIALESIRPSSKHPSIQLKLNSSTGVQCVLHFARDSPRVDLIPLVLTVTNTNTSKAISNFQCQVKVNKVTTEITLHRTIFFFLSSVECSSSVATAVCARFTCI